MSDRNQSERRNIMALTDGSMSPADYAAVSGNNNGFGNDAW